MTLYLRILQTRLSNLDDVIDMSRTLQRISSLEKEISEEQAYLDRLKLEQPELFAEETFSSSSSGESNDENEDPTPTWKSRFLPQSFINDVFYRSHIHTFFFWEYQILSKFLPN